MYFPALHVVRDVHCFTFVFVLNFPFEHALHLRSVVGVPFFNIYWPALQLVKYLHLFAFRVADLRMFADLAF